MKCFKSIAALAALAFVASAAVASTLEARIRESDGWVAYRVPMVAGVDEPCCYSVRGDSAPRKGCNLDGGSWSYSTDAGESVAAHDGTLAVYLRVARGSVERVHSVGASCPVRTASTVRWIDQVDPEDSIAMLSSLLQRKAAKNSDDHGLMALAYHASPLATRALAARAEPSHAIEEREQALFWLGQTRGIEGADIVERHATTDADPQLRSKAIFALSQSKAPDAYTHIVSIAHDDSAEYVRGQAFFWMSQMDDPRAKGDISASLKSESSDDVREQAVFALSQLDDADEALIEVLRGDYPRPVKKRALFWLGQSGSPLAMAYFDEALE